MLMFKVYEKKLQNIWKHFEDSQIEPILIKGWSAAINYPQPFLRQLGDFDLAVNPNCFDKAEKLQKHSDLREVDLHKGLRHLDTVGWDDLAKNSVLVKCGEVSIRVLRPEDHLRVLCVHWLNDGGREKEKLWDIFYAVKSRPADFDWERCLGVVSERRKKWIIYAIGLTHRYFGLEIEDNPVAQAAKKLPRWLIKAVENEWNNPVEFKYLQTCLRNRKEFFKQLRKRFPPNPIQATIEMEGDLDSHKRIFYQIGDFFLRFLPSVRRILKVAANNGKWKMENENNGKWIVFYLSHYPLSIIR
ncbi:MAG: nucleotidyltransferase family protein [Pyrinomonadaceae bacterium]